MVKLLVFLCEKEGTIKFHIWVRLLEILDAAQTVEQLLLLANTGDTAVELGQTFSIHFDYYRVMVEIVLQSFLQECHVGSVRHYKTNEQTVLHLALGGVGHITAVAHLIGRTIAQLVNVEK